MTWGKDLLCSTNGIKDLQIINFVPVIGANQTAFRDYIDGNDLDRVELSTDIYTFSGRTSDGKRFDAMQIKTGRSSAILFRLFCTRMNLRQSWREL